jgi:hypothetical protein
MDRKKKREWFIPSWSTPILLGSLNNFIFMAKNTMTKQGLLILPKIHVSRLLELNALILAFN